MSWLVLLQKFMLLGCCGVLLEFWFTSIYSLFERHWKGTGHSYFWMPFIYGATGLVLDAISTALPWPFYAKAFVYMPVIYGAEALSGVVIAGLTSHLEKYLGGSGGGVVPWNYGKSRWSPMGLINLRYLPAWLTLALGYDLISSWLQKVVAFVTTH